MSGYLKLSFIGSKSQNHTCLSVYTIIKPHVVCIGINMCYACSWYEICANHADSRRKLLGTPLDFKFGADLTSTCINEMKLQ